MRGQLARLCRTARLRGGLAAALDLAAGALPAAFFAEDAARARLAGALRAAPRPPSAPEAPAWPGCVACMPATVAAARVSNCFCSIFHQPCAAPDSAAGSD